MAWSRACLADPASQTNLPPCCRTSPVALSDQASRPAPSDRSVYQLDSIWTNDTGRALPLRSLEGKAQIVTLFFSRCSSACPLLIHQMQQIERALPAAWQSNVGFTLIAIDPERDSPDALSSYRAARRLGEHWTLLRGHPQDLLQFAALLDFRFKKDERGQFAHSNLITVLNARGEIVFQQTGLNRDPGPVVAALKKASRPPGD